MKQENATLLALVTPATYVDCPLTSLCDLFLISHYLSELAPIEL